MSKGNGRVFRPTWTQDGRTRTARTWWLDYTVHGERHREPREATTQRAALALLHQRVGDRRAGKLLGNPDDVTVHDLRVLVEKQYDLDGRRSKRRTMQCWNHVEEFFGKATRVPAVTPTRLDDYAAARLQAGRSRQTCNNELSGLRRGFRLGIEKGILATMPVFKLPKVRNARSGFFEEGDFAALLLELPAEVRPIVEFLHATGWRLGEALGLTWDAVDREGEVIRLRATETKGGEARIFPFALAPGLKALLAARWEARNGPFVFQRAGTPIRYFRHAWEAACKRAGLVGRLVHDLRRTAARDCRRVGVAEGGR